MDQRTRCDVPGVLDRLGDKGAAQLPAWREACGPKWQRPAETAVDRSGPKRQPPLDTGCEVANWVSAHSAAGQLQHAESGALRIPGLQRQPEMRDGECPRPFGSAV